MIVSGATVKLRKIALALKCCMSIWGTFVPNEASKRPGTKKSRTGCPKQAPKAFRNQKVTCCLSQTSPQGTQEPKVSYFLSQTSPESIQEPKNLVPFIPNEASKCPGTKKSRTGRPKQAPKALRNQKITCCLSQTSPKSRTSYPNQALKAFMSQKVSYRLFQTMPQSAQEAKSLVLVVPNKPPRHLGTKK